MSADHRDDAVECSQPIDAAVLADYWLGALAPAEEEPVEAHLFECGQCGARLREVMALADGLRRVADEGSLRMIVSDSHLQRAAEHGLRIREYTVPMGGSVQCTVTEADDLLVGRLDADLRGASRVDLCFCDGHGVEQTRLTDIPVHDGTTSVAFQESLVAMKGAPSMIIIARLVTVGEAGGERVLGEYTFNHTRSIPGPAAW